MKRLKGAVPKGIPADILEIVGNADEAERLWIADRLGEMARRIRATVPTRKRPRRRRKPRQVPGSGWREQVSR